MKFIQHYCWYIYLTFIFLFCYLFTVLILLTYYYYYYYYYYTIIYFVYNAYCQHCWYAGLVIQECWVLAELRILLSGGCGFYLSFG